jgi:hypothetical protein
MKIFHRHLLSFALAAVLFAPVLVAPVFLTGCSAHAGYRTYDPYYNDYHVWDDAEVGYYTHWEHETHRDHRDFDKRSDAEKKEYYSWRHNQH